jgi:tRNA1(Val) A37 N6-methylase TrmN6
VIGNPPYVRYRDIGAATRKLLRQDGFDERSNLYLFFIEKCVRHLAPGGELIFITPRDFLKATSARRSTAGCTPRAPSPTPSSWATPGCLPTPCPTA